METGSPNKRLKRREQNQQNGERRANLSTVACEKCRKRKTKCDGGRPSCFTCLVKNAECRYRAEQGETHGQADRRVRGELAQHNNDLIRRNEELEELVEVLLTKSGREHVLRHRAFEGDVESALTSPTVRGKESAVRLILLHLAQSTAAFSDIIRFMDLVDPDAFDLVDTDLAVLRHQILQFETFVNIARGSKLSHELESTGSQSPEESIDRPDFIVPAAPWTRVTADDDFVSRLICVFVNHVNSYWRYVEDGPFLQNMRSGSPGLFCSSFLVNAICAFACQHCEYPEVFDNPHKYHTRGLRFQEEAYRLWISEIGRPSLTNLQALIILAMDSNYRARDKQTSSLMSEAVRLNNELPLAGNSTSTAAAVEYNRARICAAWAVHHVDIACSTAMLRPSSPLDERLGLSPYVSVMQADYQSWTGKPYLQTPTTIRRNALFRELCVLTRRKSELSQLLFGKETSSEKMSFAQKVRHFYNELSTWYDFLPQELKYSKDLPVPLYELHAEYHCTMMTLCASVDSRSPSELKNVGSVKDSRPTSPSLHDPVVAAELSMKCDEHALQAAMLLRDYRERYGLKITLPYIFQAEALSSNNLLRRMNETTGQVVSRAGFFTHDDLCAAYEQSLRCLLGTATQVMIAHCVFRVLIRTAKQFGVVLPANIDSKVQVLHNWEPNHITQISSSYPNYAIAKDTASAMAFPMEDLLRKWESTQD